MTEQRRTDLKQLQKLDLRIKEARLRVAEFDPRFQEAEEPALILESDLGTTKTRLQEMKLEERRLELTAEEKRTRRIRLEERLGNVRNLREEAAVSAELEMVKRAIQNDEQEALTLLDQLRKMEERTAELEAAYAEATKVVEPKRKELLQQRTDAEQELESLGSERERFARTLKPTELKIYDAIRSGGRTIAVAELTEDGACGHCYGMIPLQLQNEIRHGRSLIRCESCGVILAAQDPESASAPSPAPPPAEVPEPESGDAGEDEAATVAAEADEDRVTE
jgi:predicted  nucleic acid-binding Zn-ribbon protein